MPINGFLPDCACVLRCVELFAVLWTIACQVPLSMGFFRQEYWSELPCPSPGDLITPRIKPTSLMSPTLADGFFTTSATWEAQDKFMRAKLRTFVEKNSLSVPDVNKEACSPCC